jgi:AcrR family transcriptional regulator
MAASRSLSERLGKLPSDRDGGPAFAPKGQRERIVAAVVELVGERGYRKATIEAIVKKARVALSTFYDHFEDREACFLAAFDESVEAAREAIAAQVDRERSWPDQIASGLLATLDLVAAEPARAKLCLLEAPAAGDAALARYERMLEGIAPELQAGRELSPQGARLPEGLEIAVVGGLAWSVQQRLAEDQAGRLPELAPEMLQVMLTPYLGEREAGRVAGRVEARAVA